MEETKEIKKDLKTYCTWCRKSFQYGYDDIIKTRDNAYGTLTNVRCPHCERLTHVRL